MLAALVGCAFFVLDIRQSRDLDQATAIVTSGRLSHAQEGHAAALLNAAGTLNPDPQVKLAWAQLLDDEGHSAQAIALAMQVTRDEPRNIVAWYELAQVAGNSPKTLVGALAKIKQLSPPVKHES